MDPGTAHPVARMAAQQGVAADKAQPVSIGRGTVLAASGYAVALTVSAVLCS